MSFPIGTLNAKSLFECLNIIFINIIIYNIIHSFSTAEFRNAFLKTIRQIIRESVQKMNIPTAKPSTNSPAQLVSNTATLGRQTINTGGK